MSENVTQILPPGVSAPEGAIDVSPAKKGRGRPKKDPSSPTSKGKALAIPDEQVTELAALREEYANDLKQVQSFPLDTQEQADMLTAVCQEAKRRQEDLEEKRDKILIPLKTAQKEVAAHWGPPIEFLKSIRNAGKLRLEQRFAQQRAAQAQALAAVQVSSGHVDTATMALATGAAHVKPAEGSYEREDWKHEITDLTKLPGQFWMPNDAALAAWAKEHKQAAVDGAAVIPGVRVYSVRGLVVRST